MLCAGLYRESSQQQCAQSSEKTVRVILGGNVDTEFTISDWSGELLLLRPGIWTWEICRPTIGYSCVSEINTQIRVKVSKEHGYYNLFVHLQMMIIPTTYNDHGIYHFVNIGGSSKLACTLIRVTVIVDTLPVCSTFIFNDNGFVELSCRWVPRVIGDKMQFTAKNQTLQVYEHEHRSESSDTDSTWTTTTVIKSILMATQDIFDMTFDVCVVSNYETDVAYQCSFSRFMSPKVNEISEYGREVFFTCCMETETLLGMWLYDSDNKLRSMNTTRQLFMVNMSTLYKNQAYAEKSVVLICGEENDDTLLKFSIGKLFLNLTYYDGFSLSGKIKRPSIASTDVLNGEQNCPYEHIISVTAYPLKSEHGTWGMISTTETVTNSTLHDSTRPIEPGGSCDCTDDTLSPTTNKHHKAFGDFETWISMIVVLSISLLFNIAFCIKKCFNIIGLRKCQSFEGNNPQVNLSSFPRHEEEAMEITSLSSQPVQLDEIDCSSSSQTGDDSTKHGRRIPSSRTINYRRRSEPSSSCKQECTMPKTLIGSDSLSVASYQNFLKSAINEEAYEYPEENAPRDTESLAEQNSSPVIYQSLSDNSIGESPYSFVDDTEYIIDDVPNLKYFEGYTSRDLQSSRKETSSSDIYYSLTDNDNTHGIYSVGDNGNCMRDVTIDLEGNSP